MRLDKDYKVPEGFEPVPNHRDDPSGEPVVDECCLRGAGHLGCDLTFHIGDPPGRIPALPLKANGELWHTGWDIPTRWAIDALGACWMDNAHGHPMRHVDNGRLLGEAESQRDRNHIRNLLGMGQEEPEWMAAARAAGWRPPTEGKP
jgi:hypothetical protein